MIMTKKVDVVKILSIAQWKDLEFQASTFQAI